MINRRQKPSQHRPQNPAYRRAFERLDEALAENTQSNNSEIMRRMRAEYSADVDRLEQPGTLVIPK